MDWRRRGRASVSGLLRDRLEDALALALGNRDGLERLGPWRGLRDDFEDVPLVLPLRFVLGLDHVHRLEELVVPGAEREGPAFEALHRRGERMAFEGLDEPGAVRALGFLDRLGDGVDRGGGAVRL